MFKIILYKKVVCHEWKIEAHEFMKNKEYKNFEKILKTRYNVASEAAEALFYVISACQKKYSEDKYATSECMQRSSRLLDIQDETVRDVTLS